MLLSEYIFIELESIQKILKTDSFLETESVSATSVEH